MKKSKLIIVFSLLFFSAYGNQCIPDSVFNEYKKLNDAEKRLIEFKDSDAILMLKIIHLQVINYSRSKRKKQTLKLDILASRVANKMSKEASDEGYTGHWNIAGEKPYHRYAFAGGQDHITENAYGEFSKEIGFSIGSENMKDSVQLETNKNTNSRFPFSNDSATILSYMEKAHREFMNEKAPADGHKRNILNKWHNFVGIGYYMGENNFKYYEEYIDRYYYFEDVPLIVKKNEEFSFKLKTKDDWYLYYLVAYRSKKLKKKKPFFINFKGSYKDYDSKKATEIRCWELPDYRIEQTYEFKFKFKKPGLYYFQIYQDKKESKKLYCSDINKKCNASGIVIRVDK